MISQGYYLKEQEVQKDVQDGDFQMLLSNEEASDLQLSFTKKAKKKKKNNNEKKKKRMVTISRK